MRLIKNILRNSRSDFDVEKNENSSFFSKEQVDNKLLKIFYSEDYYFSNYPDAVGVFNSGYEHYVKLGWMEGKNPSALFNTDCYLNENKDVKDAGINPLVHYIKYGFNEGRKISPVSNELILSDSLDNISKPEFERELFFNILFDSDFYLEQYPDIKDAGIDPFEHYNNFGWREQRNPSPYFNTQQYLSENEDIRAADINPLMHYVDYGRHEGRKLNVDVPKNDRFMDAYYTLNSMHSGYSAEAAYAPMIESPVKKDQDSPQVIAFYLPQFHPFKENDSWWGKGFTEWSNVAKAIPQFEGHYQPRLPSDLGYYDLRLVDTMEEQVKMATAHGVEGFCFHYYWFAGHRLMERPLEQYLEEQERLNFPFCLCWANENWSRRWDGSENDILIAQKHSVEDNEAVFYDLLRYFVDERYIKVDGKPLLVIYRPDIIPDIKGLTHQLRKLAIKEGLPGLHLVATNAFGFDQHIELGFDALVEFPPHNIEAECINYKVSKLNNDFEGYVFNYDDVVDFSLSRLDSMKGSDRALSYYPTVMTSWDNSARKPGKGNIFHGANPEKFQKWLDGCYRWSKCSHPKESKFVFINAWNEWAEGTYLEPDKKYGYAYLNSVRTTVNENGAFTPGLKEIANSIMDEKSSDYVVMAHIFYEDLIEDIAQVVNEARKTQMLDVVITLPNTFSIEAARKAIDMLNPVRVVISENRGRDVWPFLQALKNIENLQYKYGCKIHSKKSTHLKNGDDWRKEIYDGLLSASSLKKVLTLCSEHGNKFGIAAPDKDYINLEGYALRDNRMALEVVLENYAITVDKYSPFVAGTMFWFGFEWANKLLLESLGGDLFGPELGAIDGTIAHGFERALSTHSVSNGYSVLAY